jgi:hypothetical protein
MCYYFMYDGWACEHLPESYTNTPNQLSTAMIYAFVLPIKSYYQKIITYYEE